MATITDLPAKVWHHVNALELDEGSEDDICHALWIVWNTYRLFEESYPEDARRFQHIVGLLIDMNSNEFHARDAPDA